MNTSLNHTTRNFFLLLLLLSIAGCTRTTAHRLVGTWEGRPTPAEADFPTELDNVDIQVTLRLESGGRATFSRDNGSEQLQGRWSVLESSGLNARLQLAVERGAGNGELAEVRNFQIKFSEQGNQFTLTEEGADLKFGALQFVRQE